MGQKKKEIKILQKTQIVLDPEESPVIWVRDFNFEAAQKFIEQLIELNSDPDIPEIYVFISSYGGEVFSVLAMIEAIKACEKPVHTVGLGMCASAASILLGSGTGNRWLTKDSFLHIHYVRGGMYDDVPAMEHYLEQTKKVEDKLFNCLVERSNLKMKEFKEIMNKQKKEWQVSAIVAKKHGFIDKIGMPILKRYLVVEAEE